MAQDKTLYLVDGTSQLFRAYFAIRGLSNAEGMATNAVYGFTTMLRKLIKDERPTHMAVAFDRPGKVFRNELYPDYKAHRPPTPEDLNVQVPYAKQVCDALGIAILEEDGFEADDLIATYARMARERSFQVVIVASDKDLLQLVGEGVSVLNPSKNLRLDSRGVVETFGVPPERVLDAQGLMGDSVDNIPGVPGVGEKTALSIVVTYGDIDSIVARAGRFVAAYDARDALVEAMVAIEKSDSLDEATAERAVTAAARAGEALETLATEEADSDFRDRVTALGRLLAETPLDGLPTCLGAPGKSAAKPFRTLKKELKAMDRASSKRVWYAIHENAEQAQLSKQLATLDDRSTARQSFDDLAVAGAERAKVVKLFDLLGFQSLIAGVLEEADDSRGFAEPAAETQVAGDTRYEAVLTGEGLKQLVQECRGSGRIALLVLADGHDPMQAGLVGVALSAEKGSGWYVPTGHDYLGVQQQLPVKAVRDALAPLLADPELEKVAHDLKRAGHLLRRHEMPVEGWVMDTMVGAFLLDSSEPHSSMERVAKTHLGRGVTSFAELAGTGAKRIAATQLEVEKTVEYAAEQADVALQLAGVLEEKLAGSELYRVYETIDGPLLPVLARMEARGIRVDTELLGEMSQKMEAALDRLRGEIHALAGEEFNVDSPKQLREVLFEKLGLKPGRKTAKSKVASTDAQTLEELAGKHEIAAKLLEYRELSKLKGTYVDSLPRLVNPATGRVHTCYHPTGAATGRLSSSDPNLQNIPVRTEAGRQIRSAFVPAEGYVFLAADYSQIELRILAHVTEDPQLIAAFQAGDDIHRYTASKVFGVLPDLVTDTMRQRAKAVNFGILYGMSETRLAREQGMKRTEARQFIQAYFERFANVRGYIDRIREEARHNGTVRTLFGRERHFPQLHQRVHRGLQEQALRAAVNTTLQGTAADLMKLAMLRVETELEAAGLDARMLLQVHDELLLEVAEGQIRPAGEIVRRAMEEVHPLVVPLVVDQKVGSSWLDT